MSVSPLTRKKSRKNKEKQVNLLLTLIIPILRDNYLGQLSEAEEEARS